MVELQNKSQQNTVADLMGHAVQSPSQELLPGSEKGRLKCSAILRNISPCNSWNSRNLGKTLSADSNFEHFLLALTVTGVGVVLDHLVVVRVFV